MSSNGTIGNNNNYTDPLSNPSNCARDIPYLKQLRTNVIRTYAIDPTANHDDCMSMLADAGIYVISDLSEPMTSINRDDPQWNGQLYQRYISVIDSFSKYGNVIGFFAGNEVSNSPNTTAASAYVKAAVRDSKAYIKNQNYGSLGVGYATYDGDIRTELAEYFNCGNQSAAIDFWGYNVYSWCGNSSYQTSGYQERTDFFRDYSVPIFFAEYGCNIVEPRTFTDVPVLFGPMMDEVWSGGIVYMYFQEANNYGLVNVNGNSVSPRQDFSYLSSQMATISPSSTNMNDYNPTFSPTSCPAVVTATSGTNSQLWLAQATPLPPTPNQEVCNCVMSTLNCVSNSNDAESYMGDFNYICGLNNGQYCQGIAGNATTGTYGALSQCNPQQQLSWVMNQYYNAQSGSNKASACAFSGRAKTQAASSATGSCQPLVQAVGTAGTGTVPQPTGNSQQQSSAGGGSSDGSSGGSASSSKSDASGLVVHVADFGVLQAALYISVAALTGAGMIFL